MLGGLCLLPGLSRRRLGFLPLPPLLVQPLLLLCKVLDHAHGKGRFPFTYGANISARSNEVRLHKWMLDRERNPSQLELLAVGLQSLRLHLPKLVQLRRLGRRCRRSGLPLPLLLLLGPLLGLLGLLFPRLLGPPRLLLLLGPLLFLLLGGYIGGSLSNRHEFKIISKKVCNMMFLAK